MTDTRIASHGWIRPRRLAHGARLAVVAPASPFRREEFEAGVQELAGLGFETVYDDRVFARDGFVAGDPALRARALADAWQDPAIDGIISVRGGYGSAQLLPRLDPDLPRRHPKVFIGYSDVTSLLAWHLAAGVICFHGPMLEGRLARGAAGYDRASLVAATMNAAPMGRLAPDGLAVLRAGDASGVLVGGTLTQLAASLGTPWAFNPPEGCLLFLEDVGERPYRLDRLLLQLEQAGVLATVAGVLLGEFPGCDEPDGAVTAREVLRARLAAVSGPVVFGFPSGHTAGPSWTLPLGVRARLDAGAAPAVVIEEAAVV
ncbi:MAG: LD-carboxypeptidase [Vicinamibacterales bacterium]|nr:LD-carboxypeptidase [Vicinamibacterales bacterium]